MSKKIYQCCYTNLTQEVGGKIQSGWQTVAASQDIPSEAYKKCEQLQRVNSTIPGSMMDENGEVLNLLEISGDDKFVYIMRTQYGLQDRLGRRNMFSHAYILWWKDVILEPNSFLQIADKANFCSDRDTALRLLEEPDREICQSRGYTIEQALEAAGLHLRSKSYPELIGCIYARMSERRLNTPLYIQCDSEEQMQALLFCIYYGLPHYLRKKLHAASAAGNSTENKHIIFSRAAAGQPCHFDPKSGENTVLSGRLPRKLQRYGFIDYVARNTAAGDYFAHLAEEAASLGDLSASDELILKIAHKRLMVSSIEPYSDSEMDELLSDALRSSAFGSAAMCEYITQLLNRARAEQRRLPDETQSRLPVWETACVLSEAQKEELARLKEEFIGWKEKKHQELTSQIEEKYRKLQEQCREELEEAEKKSLELRLRQLENDVQAEKKRRIAAAYQKREAELVEEHKKKEATGKINLVNEVCKNFKPRLEDAEKHGQEKTAAALKKEQIWTIQDCYDQILRFSRADLGNKLAQVHKEIEARVSWELENYAAQSRWSMQQESERLLEENIRQKRTELDWQEQTELAQAYAKLEEELENGKPTRLTELESKETLAQALKEYTRSYLQALSSEEVLQELDRLREDRLSQYVSMLLEVENGKRIVSAYCDDLLGKQPLSWETLRRAFAVSGSAGIRTDSLKKKLDGLAWTLYCQSLDCAGGTISPDFDQYQSFLAKFTPPELVETKTARAKEEFWKKISFANFSMEAFPGYSQMLGEMSRCKMFSEFYETVNNLTTAGETEFLNKVRAFFVEFRKELGPDDRENALALLEKAVKERYHGSDPFLMKWVYVLMMDNSEQMFDKIAAVRSALYEGRYNDLLSEYDRIAESESERSGDLKQAIREIILADCDRRDSSENPVPLDIWLWSAGDEVGSSFDIFDVKSPAILQRGSFEVVYNSRLLQTEKYSNAANDYVQRRGRQYKIVKQWIKEKKRIAKSNGNRRMWGDKTKKNEAEDPDVSGSGS